MTIRKIVEQYLKKNNYDGLSGVDRDRDVICTCALKPFPGEKLILMSECGDCGFFNCVPFRRRMLSTHPDCQKCDPVACKDDGGYCLEFQTEAKEPETSREVK